MNPAQVSALVQHASSQIALATQEFQAIHAMCDRMNVPREFNSEKLSGAQRVGVLVGTYEALVKRVGQDMPRPPETTQ